ncbi:gtpase activating rap [Pelomyxa schiedti]|nr:gtpase activating rap [Pelomyxa schiedti]
MRAQQMVRKLHEPVDESLVPASARSPPALVPQSASASASASSLSSSPPTVVVPAPGAANKARGAKSVAAPIMQASPEGGVVGGASSAEIHKRCATTMLSSVPNLKPKKKCLVAFKKKNTNKYLSTATPEKEDTATAVVDKISADKPPLCIGGGSLESVQTKPEEPSHYHCDVTLPNSPEQQKSSAEGNSGALPMDTAIVDERPSQNIVSDSVIYTPHLEKEELSPILEETSNDTQLIEIGEEKDKADEQDCKPTTFKNEDTLLPTPLTYQPLAELTACPIVESNLTTTQISEQEETSLKPLPPPRPPPSTGDTETNSKCTEDLSLIQMSSPRSVTEETAELIITSTTTCEQDTCVVPSIPTSAIIKPKKRGRPRVFDRPSGVDIASFLSVQPEAPQATINLPACEIGGNEASSLVTCTSVSEKKETLPLPPEDSTLTILTPGYYMQACSSGLNSMAISKSLLKTDIPLPTEPWYCEYFFGKEHTNYIGEATPDGLFIASVLEPVATQSTRVLIRSKNKDYKGLITGLPGSKVPLQEICTELQTGMKIKKYSQEKKLEHAPLTKLLKRLEECQDTGSYHFGVVYCRDSQTTEDEFFSNENGSYMFEQFLLLLGDKICLQGWQGYNAGLDVTNNATGTHSIFTKSLGFNVMLHVSTLLPFSTTGSQVERKRHLATDTVVLYYLEGNSKLDVSSVKLESNCVFITVKYRESKFICEICCKSYVPDFGPAICTPFLFDDPEVFARFLLCKGIIIPPTIKLTRLQL